MRILIRPRPPQSIDPAHRVVVRAARIGVSARPLRVLDFDIENRPLSYLGSDFTTAEVTTIAWAWTDQPHAVTVYLLGETDLPDILRRFVAVFDAADMVTGHFILGHDLPMINGALMECRMPVLNSKMVHDTKCHLIRRKGISCSQESLSAMLRLEQSKVQMNQMKWRSANRLTPEGLALVRERVVGDVKQNIAMRQELSSLGYLSSPKLWRSGTARVESYAP